MTILSDLRSSRFARQQKNITQSLIVFTLRREWFALPIDFTRCPRINGRTIGILFVGGLAKSILPFA
jgi:hypothetical protein